MKVLVVDDLDEGRSFVEELIRYMGHEVSAVENGRIALDLLAEEKFDLVISDILMPVMDGYQLCKAIKSDNNLNKTPVIFLTATYTEEQDQELAERMGAEMLVKKPIEASRLMDIIDNLLTGSSKGALAAPKEPDVDQEILDLYSKRLIYQLEKKMVELEAEVKDRIQKEKELLRSRQQLRDLFAHLQNIREQERMHLAREIHDELGQALTALRMDAKFIESKAGQAAVTERVHGMIDFIDHTADKVQSMCSELRPSILDDLGLSAAMDWLVNEYRKRSENLNYEYDFDDNNTILSQEIATTAFRILQEALTNVIKHANAENVMIDLSIDDENLTLTIADDGKGFTPYKMDRSGSFGVLGMKERAINIRGSLQIKSEPGKGTEITLTIPLKGEVDEHQSSGR